MFLLDGRALSPDRAFTHLGIQYPRNWLRLASPEERAAIGITEVPDPPRWDERFYWGYDADGNLIPKQLNDEPVLDEDGNDTGEVSTGLKTQWKATQGGIAASLLAPSDWRVIKAKETGSNMPAAWKAYRAAVRTACNTRQDEIDACADVAALKELLFGSATVAQTDADGNSVMDDDGNLVMIANPALATAWPEAI